MLVLGGGGNSLRRLRCRIASLVFGPGLGQGTNLGIFEAEGHKDVVPLVLKVVFCDRSARS
jgi:hypothetical protein